MQKILVGLLVMLSIVYVSIGFATNSISDKEARKISEARSALNNGRAIHFFAIMETTNLSIDFEFNPEHPNYRTASLVFASSAQREQSIANLEKLLDKGAGANTTNLKGETLFHILIERLSANSMKFASLSQMEEVLISFAAAWVQKGGELSKKTQSGESVLDYSLQKGLFELSKVLVKQKVSLQKKTYEYVKALSPEQLPNKELISQLDKLVDKNLMANKSTPTCNEAL